MKERARTLNDYFEAAQRAFSISESEARAALDGYLRARARRRGVYGIVLVLLAWVVGGWIITGLDDGVDDGTARATRRIVSSNPAASEPHQVTRSPQAGRQHSNNQSTGGRTMNASNRIPRVAVGALTALLSLNAVSAQGDLISNGGYEQLTAAGWTITGDTLYPSMASLYTVGDSAYVFEGIRAARLTFGSGSSDVFQSIALPQNRGESVTLSFRLLMPTRGSGSNKWLQAQIVQYETMPNCVDRLGYRTAITDSVIVYDGDGEQYGAWTEIARTFRLDSRARYLRLQFTTGNGSGGPTDPLWIDDVSLVDAANGTELLTNGGFEQLGATDWTITGDTRYPSIASLYQVGDAAYVHRGSNSAQLTFGSGSSDVFQTIVLPHPIDCVRLSFWLLMPTRGSGNNKWLQAQIIQYDSMPNCIDRLGYRTALTDEVIAYDGNEEQYTAWTRITRDFKLDPRARSLRLQFTTGNGSGGPTDPLWIDDVQLEPIVCPDGAVDDQAHAVEQATVAPNPATSGAHLDFTVRQTGRYRVAMYTNGGRLVATLLNEQVTFGRWRLPIDVSRLSAGAYHLTIEGGGGRRSVEMQVVR